MNYGWISGAIGIVIAVVGFWRSSVKTKAQETAIDLIQTNHLSHVQEELDELKQDTKVNEKSIAKIFTEMKGISTSLEALKEQCNKNHK